MNKPLIEACVDSYASCMAAAKGGADRLELCANLAIGGTTPSAAVFKQVKRDCDVKINVLIRPRFGDFLYSEAEMEEMCEEIKMFRDLGANGVVIGTLTPEGMLDEEKMRRLMDCAGGIDVTLHRAFDMTCDPVAALEAAIRLGCRTVLTSGQAPSALAGREVLCSMHKQAAGRIHIMAGCGVKSGNIREIFSCTGILTYHTSGRRAPAGSGMTYRREGVSMGLPSLSEYEIWQTDEQEFRACAEIVHGLSPMEA